MPVDVSQTRIAAISHAAAEAWDATVFHVLSHGSETPRTLARTLQLAPDFALAHALAGLLTLTMAKGDGIGAAKAALDRCEALLDHGCSREGLYGAALAAWLAGRPHGAADALESVIADHPTDVLAFKLAQMIRFMAGDRPGMAAAAVAYVDTIGATPSLTGFASGCAAFAVEEQGEFVLAERLGRRAVDLEPKDAWGRHAVAHVYEMTGRARDGAQFLARQPNAWSHCGNFGGHLSWHHALFLMEERAFDAVLALYDDKIRRPPTEDVRDFANAVSLLVRLEVAGVDVGHRWQELADAAMVRRTDGRWCFADLHTLVALARAGQDAEATALARQIELGTGRQGYDRKIASEIAGPLAAGLLAHVRGEHARAVRLLSGMREAALALGGSNAQRDMFEQMYLDSLARSDPAKARVAATTRLSARRGRNALAQQILARTALPALSGRVATTLSPQAVPHAMP